MSGERKRLEASRPVRASGLQNCTDPPPSQRVEVTILVRRRTEPQAQLEAILRGDAPPMTRDEAAGALGADSQEIHEVAQFAQSQGLAVTESSAAERCLKISGTVAQMEAAFGVKLRRAQIGDECYLYYDEPLTVPSSLAPMIEAVLGLDQRPIANSR